MKELDKEFEDNRFKYEQIKRAENVALYKRYKIGQPKSFHYEVVNVMLWGEREIFGRIHPAGEYYPSPSSWGVHGFTYYGNEFGEEQALKKFEELLAHNALRANTLEEK